MSEAKPKIEGAKKFRLPMRAAGQPTKKELVTKVRHRKYEIRIKIQEDSQCDSQLQTERV